jgi:sugar transferase EpsL
VNKRTGEKIGSLYLTGVKRLLDVIVSVLSLMIFSPVFFLIMVAIRIFMGTPIFFRQERPGLHGRPFNIFKFRTMINIRNAQGILLPDAKRLTAFGHFLRSTSMDELPELFNVLKGEMSIVGPRPLLMQYLDRYTPEQMRRHEVKPGITGWAQVNGRNAITWEDKFRFDIWYVDNQSLQLDFKIIALTIWKILKREGINQPGQATAKEFKGDKK